MLRARLAPVLLLALTGGCSEDPSFSVRWRLHPYTETEPTDAKPLISVDQCTELGISQIRVTTRNAVGDVVDEREFPCFPRGFDDEDAVAPGPAVGPGTYSVILTALGRRGIPFCNDPEEGGTGDDGTTDTGTTTDTGGTDDVPACKEVVASDAKEVVVRETGENTRHDDFIIVGVPQCRDGVDNDRDGYSDLADPSCKGDRDGSEVGEGAGVQVIVRPQLMSGTASATCIGLGLRDIELAISGPMSLTRRFPCTTTAQTFTEDVVPGDYTLAVSGIGYDGAVIAAITLDPATAAFTLAPNDFRTIDLPADFTIASFDEKIEAGFAFSLEYAPSPDSFPVASCTPVEGGLILDRLAITLLDADQQLIPTATLANGDLPAIVLDGTTTIPCSELLKVRTVEPLTWDDIAPGYEAVSVRVEAFPGGSNTPCYGNTDAPTPAAPNASFVMTLPRLSDQGDCADSP